MPPLTPAPTATDAQGVVWSITGGWICRDGVQTNGRGTVIIRAGVVIWVKGRNGNWWQWLGNNAWRDAGSGGGAWTWNGVPAEFWIVFG